MVALRPEETYGQRAVLRPPEVDQHEGTNGLRRPQRIRYQQSGGAVHYESWNYGYDGAGNIWSIGSDRYHFRDGEGRVLRQYRDAETLRRLVDAELYLPFADAPAFERMRRAASRLVDRYVLSYAEDLGRVWTVERPFELHVPDGTVAGRADVILDEEAGRIGSLAIVDYKVAHDRAWQSEVG